MDFYTPDKLAYVLRFQSSVAAVVQSRGAFLSLPKIL